APSTRELLIIGREEIGSPARDAATVARGKKSLFFCQSRALTETVAEHMRGAGTDVFVHHSSVSTEERQHAEERFHHGSDACTVCTSTLELGIDVGDPDKVFQGEPGHSPASTPDGSPHTPQHFLCFFPLPHGQGSFRPGFASARSTGLP